MWLGRVMRQVLQTGVSFHIRDRMNVKTNESIGLRESELRDFFEKWNLYRKIIDFNYMFHDEIAGILNNFFQDYFEHPFKLLDLGCGDSHTAFHSLKNTNIQSYSGVDLSRTALDFAQEKLENFDIKKEFIQGDLFWILDDLQQGYDVIQIGYSMHHLTYGDKKILLDKCSGILNTHGVLVLYDVCRNEIETRDEYFVRYWSNCEKLWVDLDSGELELLHNHIHNYDYPESFNTLSGLLRESEFKKHEVLFRDQPGFHFLMLCYR